MTNGPKLRSCLEGSSSEGLAITTCPGTELLLPVKGRDWSVDDAMQCVLCAGLTVNKIGRFTGPISRFRHTFLYAGGRRAIGPIYTFYVVHGNLMQVGLSINSTGVAALKKPQLLK